MCGRFGQVLTEEAITHDLQHPVEFSTPLIQRYNCAPSQSVYCGIPLSQRIRFGELEWGVNPHGPNVESSMRHGRKPRKTVGIGTNGIVVWYRLLDFMNGHLKKG